MKNLLLLLLASLSFYTCTSPVSPAPPDLIPQEKMVSVLIDLHVAEARVERIGLPTDSAAIYYKDQQLLVFNKHKIKNKDFYKSYDYYLHNVSELDKIYEKVVDSLSMKEVEFDKAKDSLQLSE